MKSNKFTTKIVTCSLRKKITCEIFLNGAKRTGKFGQP